MAQQAQVEWRGPEYLRAARTATKESLLAATKLVAKTAKADAPRSEKHRVKRTYPGGRSYSDAKRIHQSIRPKVVDRVRRGTINAFVKANVGYATFVEHDRKKRGGGVVQGKFFMANALRKNEGAVIEILRGKWPK